MHIPSDNVYKEMLHEAAGIWFVHTEGTDTHAILLKAYANILKAVMAGCEVQISFAVDESRGNSILVSCVQIFDDRAAPVMIVSPHLKQLDHKALIDILNRKTTPIFLFDELCRNIAWAESTWSEPPIPIIYKLSLFQSFYVGESIKVVQKALNNIQVCLDPKLPIPLANPIKFEKVVLVFQDFHDINIYGYSLNDGVQKFNSLSKDEGGGFEQSVWQLLEDIFFNHLYRSPQVISDNGKIRELTDLLSFTDKGLFLFETKASSVFNTSLDRSTERRAKNLEGQIEKAIKQLSGGVRAIRSKQNIVSVSGAEICFNRNIVPHGIVVVSEMLPSVNWEKITQLCMEDSLSTSSMLHVLDLHELLVFVGSSLSAYHFDYYLMKRFEEMVARKTTFFRVKIIKP